MVGVLFWCLLVLHFVGCFVSLGLLLVSISLSHLAASSYTHPTSPPHPPTPAKQPAGLQARVSAGVDLGPGVTLTGPGERTRWQAAWDLAPGASSAGRGGSEETGLLRPQFSSLKKEANNNKKL